MSGAAGNEWRTFASAVQFLTRLPVPDTSDYSLQRLAAAVRYFPLVGALIGGLCAAVFWLAQLGFPIPVAIVFALATGVAVTGAFHEDGLADTIDGIGAAASDRKRALEIMRDSRLGTYGTIALVAALALKFAALAALPALGICVALVAGHGLSRLSSVLAMQTGSYVREDGAGTPVAGPLGGFAWFMVLLTGLLLTAGLASLLSPAAALLALGGAAAGHVAMRLYYEPRLNGYTGDTLGAVQQASEVGLYLGLSAWIWS